MATTKIYPTAAFYGHANDASYASSAANHLYAGKGDGTYNYRSRMAFKPLSSIAAIGNSRIAITKAVLYICRDGGGPTTVYAGCSASARWGAALAATGSARCSTSNGYKAIDITACANAMTGYTGTWYVHISGSTDNRIRFDGTGEANKPYIAITWEYVAATISGDKEDAVLGEPITYTVAPEAEGETHTLTYAIGGLTGTIASLAGDSIIWTPPVELATEFPDAESGDVELTMKVYDAAGTTLLRTEKYYQTVTAPESAKPVIQTIGASLANALAGYGLTGRSHIAIAPVIDMTGALGATIRSMDAAVVNGDFSQVIAWTSVSEGEPGIFSGASADTGILPNAGTAVIALDVIDSRGRAATATVELPVCAYASPAITGFAVDRYEPVYDENEEITGYQASDLGGYVWVDIAAAASEVAPEGTQLNSLAWTLTMTNPATGETRAVNGAGAQGIAIAADRALIPDAIPEEDTWQCTLTLTDTAGSTALAYDTVLPGRANFSLAASKYGACFGGIAKGTRDSPMLESYYPIHAYGGIRGGIHGVTNYVLGETPTGGTWIDGKPIYRMIFTNSLAVAEGGTTLLPTGIVAIDTLIRVDGYVRYLDAAAPVNNQGRITDGTARTRSVDLVTPCSANPQLRIHSGTSAGTIAVGAAWFLLEYTKP